MVSNVYNEFHPPHVFRLLFAPVSIDTIVRGEDKLTLSVTTLGIPGYPIPRVPGYPVLIPVPGYHRALKWWVSPTGTDPMNEDPEMGNLHHCHQC
eukprot:2574284-Rhodomonas_salina.2